MLPEIPCSPHLTDLSNPPCYHHLLDQNPDAHTGVDLEVRPKIPDREGDSLSFPSLCPYPYISYTLILYVPILKKIKNTSHIHLELSIHVLLELFF